MEHIVNKIDEISYIEDLESKYEALLKRVELLEALMTPQAVASVQQPTIVAGLEEFPTLTKEILDAVCDSTGMKAAAIKLDMTTTQLEKILIASGVPHLYGEKWSVSLKRVRDKLPLVDNFTYPKELYEKKERMLKWWKEKKSFKHMAEQLELPQSVVGRFLQKELGVERWKHRG